MTLKLVFGCDAHVVVGERLLVAEYWLEFAFFCFEAWLKPYLLVD